MMVVEVFVDASAAVGVAQRKGFGRIRHMGTQALWIQDAVRQRKVSLTTIEGTVNPADTITKFLGSAELAAMMARLGLEALDGRAALAPQMANDYSWQEDLVSAGSSVSRSSTSNMQCEDDELSAAAKPFVSSGAKAIWLPRHRRVRCLSCA